MTVAEAIKILDEELESRKSNDYDYDATITEAIEMVLDYAKRSAPR